MKTNYYQMWMRADKHLNNDCEDLFLHEGKEGEEETAVACSLSGMTNAYYALKYIVMHMLRDKGEPFEESADLHVLLDTLLITDAYPIRKENILWAYEMESWYAAAVLKEDTSEPFLKPLTHDELELVSSRIYKVRCIFEGEDGAEDWS